ncbi:protein O-mannosyl-transferase TMTC1 isoform X2 [Leucoraja erinacea]|uniref:protein O-mannosyl-transferase TMTC1 isoform X1 n=1 Tax=Leucoraja erinaceus TaxID=7782 RepID=UPI0024558EB4|nr:protein O-mannosyl-transferase TMTC1 isoform X1 [Leucoraja erinacea]XP_055506294.1 protein O-mannosyl-transferase TMTC1 isoform X2 [Leucoraja erinacea]
MERQSGAGGRLTLSLWHGLLAALCAAAAYCNGLPGELVHDDVWAIINNPDLRASAPLRGIFSNDFWGRSMGDNSSHKSYRPLCILTFKLNILLGGMTPLYFHMVNVGLHCAVTSLLLHTCDKAVFRDTRPALLAALLFAVHPVHTEAVTGIVGRADVLACVLYLLTFLSYLRSVNCNDVGESFPPTSSPVYLLLSLFFGTCAMLVKETGITVFGVCLIYDLLILCSKRLLTSLPAERTRGLLKISAPYLKRAVLVTLYVLLILFFRVWIMAGSMPNFSEQDNPASFSPHLLTRFLTYSYLLTFNAWLLLAPITLCYDWQVGSIPLVESLWDGRNVATVVFGLAMVLLTRNCLLSLLKQEHREVLVGLLFLVFPFIPASNLFFRVGFVVAERVLYMPSMGYCILVAHGLNRLCGVLSRWGASVVTVSTLLVLGLFFWKTLRQNEVWLSREALFRSGVQTLPLNAKVHYNYANFLKDHGRYDEAVYHYKTALRLYPRHASALNNLGTLTKDVPEAEDHYRQALKLNPQHNRALFNLGNLLKSQKKLLEAEQLLRDSVRSGPQFADAYSSLAALLAEQERFEEADDIYTRGVENCPENSDLHNNYGVFLVDRGDGKTASGHYLHAIRLNPKHYVAMLNLGRLLRSANKNKEAETWYKRALNVTRTVDVLSPLGALYYNTGRYEEALQIYKEAISMQPKNSELQLAVAQVLSVAGRPRDAERIINQVASERSNCLECQRLLSVIHSKSGNLKEALEAVKKAVQMKTKDPKVLAELYFSEGNLLRELNRLDVAFESYKQAVELSPDLSQAWMNMGGIRHIKGDYVAARGYYEKALELVPNSKILRENLSKLDRLEKKLQEDRRVEQSAGDQGTS